MRSRDKVTEGGCRPVLSSLDLSLPIYRVDLRRPEKNLGWGMDGRCSLWVHLPPPDKFIP